jgi:hypothetical protein
MTTWRAAQVMELKAWQDGISAVRITGHRF